ASTNSVSSRLVRTSSRVAESLIFRTFTQVDIGRQRRRGPVLGVPVDVAGLETKPVEVAVGAVVPTALPVGFARPGEEGAARYPRDDDVDDGAQPGHDLVADVDLERLVPGPLRHHLVARQHGP